MNARELQAADAGTPLEVPPPVLFNTYKHHAGALRTRIRRAIAEGEVGLLEAAARTAVLGTRLMDFYTGQLTPRELADRVVTRLEAGGVLPREAFFAWVGGQGGYAVVELPEDGSRWVLRAGEDATRHVHLHPGRWSPATVRVKANVLKTAYLALIHAGVQGGDPTDRALLNAVRRDHLGLEPLGRDPEGELGLGAILALLRGA